MLTYYLRGERVPTLTTLVRIADYFECNSDYLLGLESMHHVTPHALSPFSERFRAMLDKYEKTAYQVSIETKISNQCIYHWKNGKRRPNVEDAVKIADCFGVSLDELLGREN